MTGCNRIWETYSSFLGIIHAPARFGSLGIIGHTYTLQGSTSLVALIRVLTKKPYQTQKGITLDGLGKECLKPRRFDVVQAQGLVFGHWGFGGSVWVKGQELFSAC